MDEFENYYDKKFVLLLEEIDYCLDNYNILIKYFKLINLIFFKLKYIEIMISNNNLYSYNLTNPNLTNPNLTNPNLTNANLYRQNLTNPNLTNPNIKNSNIKNTNLTNPNIKNSNIKNTNIKNTTIKTATKKDKYDYIYNIDDNIADIIIPLIVLVFLIIFFIFIISLLSYSNFQATTPENPVISDTRGSLTRECKIGECATNIINGYKICSDDENQPIRYNPTSEVCNKKYECNNTTTPYAIKADGSTTITGICEDKVACSCIKNPQCPNYILSAFTTINGSLLKSINNQRIIFPQANSNTNNGIITTSNPIQLQNPVLQFCSAPLSYLQYASPGCNAILAKNDNSLSYQDLLDCMGMEKNCTGTVYETGGYKGSPCLQGTLAIITDNPDTLNQSQVNSFLLGCVPGETCPCGKVGVFNTNFGALQCLTIPQ
jgi:hypothetical protein